MTETWVRERVEWAETAGVRAAALEVTDAPQWE